jgi:steroid delta-isomerase-like uncharacterized protein
MTMEESRNVVHRWFELFNDDLPRKLGAREGDVVGHAVEEAAQRLVALDEVLAPDAKIHVPGNDGPMNPGEYKRFLAEFYRAFPDLEVTIEDEVTEGDKTTARWTIRGEHRGDFRGVPATGKPVTLTGIAIWRIVDGKAVEEWVEWDALGLMQQLGAIPAG